MVSPLVVSGALLLPVAFLLASCPSRGRATLLGAPPLQIVKVLSLGASPDTAAALRLAGLPPPPLDALVAWKKAVAGAILNPPILPLPAPPPPPPSPAKPPPTKPPPSPPSPPPPAGHQHHHHHHHRHHRVGADCCCCRGDRSSASSSADSSAASSEEDEAASREARLQRCVRTVAPNMLVDNSYGHVAQTDACTARGLQVLASGATTTEARDTIVSCMAAAQFPSALAPFVQDFNSCVSRVLNAPE